MPNAHRAIYFCCYCIDSSVFSVLLSGATLFKCTSKLAFSEKKNKKTPHQNNLTLTANTHPPRTNFSMLLSNLDEIYSSICLCIRKDVLS